MASSAKNIFDFTAGTFKRMVENQKAKAEAEAAANYPLTMSSGVSLGTIILIGVGGALLLHFIRGR